MDKLTPQEEREYNHLRRKLFDKKSFIEMDFVSNQLLLNRYNELANRKTKSVLTKTC
mgnify:CR=1 FL=1|tara:strand:+ start:1135 stop:1305 length:171 start_codon:yes stop_codon:yes gene_type:complete